MNSNFNKSDKGKSKFTSLNINSVYKGRAPEQQSKPAVQKYGMQVVGQVKGMRRMPPPALIPSIKAETGGNDFRVNLVPTGSSGWGGPNGSSGQPGSGKETPEERGERGSPHFNQSQPSRPPPQQPSAGGGPTSWSSVTGNSGPPPPPMSNDSFGLKRNAPFYPQQFPQQDFPKLGQDSVGSGGPPGAESVTAGNGTSDQNGGGNGVMSLRPQTIPGNWRQRRVQAPASPNSGDMPHPENLGEGRAISPPDFTAQKPFNAPSNTFNRPTNNFMNNSGPKAPFSQPRERFNNSIPSEKATPFHQPQRSSNPTQSSSGPHSASNKPQVKGDIAATGWAAVEDEPNFDETIIFSDEEDDLSAPREPPVASNVSLESPVGSDFPDPMLHRQLSSDSRQPNRPNSGSTFNQASRGRQYTSSSASSRSDMIEGHREAESEQQHRPMVPSPGAPPRQGAWQTGGRQQPPQQMQQGPHFVGQPPYPFDYRGRQPQQVMQPYYNVARMPIGPSGPVLPQTSMDKDGDQQHWMGEQRNVRAQQYKDAIAKTQAKKKQEEQDRNTSGAKSGPESDTRRRQESNTSEAGESDSLPSRSMPEEACSAPGGPPIHPQQQMVHPPPPHLAHMPYGPHPGARFPWAPNMPPQMYPMMPQPMPAALPPELCEKFLEFLKSQQPHNADSSKKHDTNSEDEREAAKEKKRVQVQSDPFAEEDSEHPRGKAWMRQRTPSDAQTSEHSDSHQRPPSNASSSDHQQPRILKRDPAVTRPTVNSSTQPHHKDQPVAIRQFSSDDPDHQSNDLSTDKYPGRRDQNKGPSSGGPVALRQGHGNSQRQDSQQQQQNKPKPLMEKPVKPVGNVGLNEEEKGGREFHARDPQKTGSGPPANTSQQQQHTSKSRDNREDYNRYNSVGYRDEYYNTRDMRNAPRGGRRNDGSGYQHQYYNSYGGGQSAWSRNPRSDRYDEYDDEYEYDDEDEQDECWREYVNRGGGGGSMRGGRGTRGTTYMTHSGRGTRGRLFTRGRGGRSADSNGSRTRITNQLTDMRHDRKVRRDDELSDAATSGDAIADSECPPSATGHENASAKRQESASKSDQHAGSKSQSASRSSTEPHKRPVQEDKSATRTSRNQRGGKTDSRSTTRVNRREKDRGRKEHSESPGVSGTSSSQGDTKAESQRTTSEEGKSLVMTAAPPPATNVWDTVHALVKKPSNVSTPTGSAPSDPAQAPSSESRSRQGTPSGEGVNEKPITAVETPTQNTSPGGADDKSNRGNDRQRGGMSNSRGRRGGRRGGGNPGVSNRDAYMDDRGYGQQARRYDDWSNGGGYRGRERGGGASRGVPRGAMMRYRGSGGQLESGSGRGGYTEGSLSKTGHGGRGGGRDKRQVSVSKDVSDGNEQEEWETASEGSEGLSGQHREDRRPNGNSESGGCGNRRRGGSGGGGRDGGASGGSGSNGPSGSGGHHGTSGGSGGGMTSSGGERGGSGSTYGNGKASNQYGGRNTSASGVTSSTNNNNVHDNNRRGGNESLKVSIPVDKPRQLPSHIELHNIANVVDVTNLPEVTEDEELLYEKPAEFQEVLSKSARKTKRLEEQRRQQQQSISPRQVGGANSSGSGGKGGRNKSVKQAEPLMSKSINITSLKPTSGRIAKPHAPRKPVEHYNNASRHNLPPRLARQQSGGDRHVNDLVIPSVDDSWPVSSGTDTVVTATMATLVGNSRALGHQDNNNATLSGPHRPPSSSAQLRKSGDFSETRTPASLVNSQNSAMHQQPHSTLEGRLVIDSWDSRLAENLATSHPRQEFVSVDQTKSKDASSSSVCKAESGSLPKPIGTRTSALSSTSSRHPAEKEVGPGSKDSGIETAESNSSSPKTSLLMRSQGDARSNEVAVKMARPNTLIDKTMQRSSVKEMTSEFDSSPSLHALTLDSYSDKQEDEMELNFCHLDQNEIGVVDKRVPETTGTKDVCGGVISDVPADNTSQERLDSKINSVKNLWYSNSESMAMEGGCGEAVSATASVSVSAPVVYSESGSSTTSQTNICKVRPQLQQQTDQRAQSAVPHLEPQTSLADRSETTTPASVLASSASSIGAISRAPGSNMSSVYQSFLNQASASKAMPQHQLQAVPPQHQTPSHYGHQLVMPISKFPTMGPASGLQQGGAQSQMGFGSNTPLAPPPRGLAGDSGSLGGASSSLGQMYALFQCQGNTPIGQPQMPPTQHPVQPGANLTPQNLQPGVSTGFQSSLSNFGGLAGSMIPHGAQQAINFGNMKQSAPHHQPGQMIYQPNRPQTAPRQTPTFNVMGSNPALSSLHAGYSPAGPMVAPPGHPPPHHQFMAHPQAQSNKVNPSMTPANLQLGSGNQNRVLDDALFHSNFHTNSLQTPGFASDLSTTHFQSGPSQLSSSGFIGDTLFHQTANGVYKPSQSSAMHQTSLFSGQFFTPQQPTSSELHHQHPLPQQQPMSQQMTSNNPAAIASSPTSLSMDQHQLAMFSSSHGSSFSNPLDASMSRSTGGLVGYHGAKQAFASSGLTSVSGLSNSQPSRQQHPQFRDMHALPPTSMCSMSGGPSHRDYQTINNAQQRTNYTPAQQQPPVSQQSHQQHQPNVSQSTSSSSAVSRPSSQFSLPPTSATLTNATSRSSTKTSSTTGTFQNRKGTSSTSQTGNTTSAFFSVQGSDLGYENTHFTTQTEEMLANMNPADLHRMVQQMRNGPMMADRSYQSKKGPGGPSPRSSNTSGGGVPPGSKRVGGTAPSQQNSKWPSSGSSMSRQSYQSKSGGDFGRTDSPTSLLMGQSAKSSGGKDCGVSGESAADSLSPASVHLSGPTVVSVAEI